LRGGKFINNNIKIREGRLNNNNIKTTI